MVRYTTFKCRKGAVLSCYLSGAEPVEHLLDPREGELIRSSTSRRRQSFAQGRLAARRALVALGRPADAVLRMPSGAPAWPYGIRGSVSHCEGLAVALVTTDNAISSVGIDVETCQPLPPHVKSALQHDYGPDQDCAPSSLPRLGFSAREAAFKALPRSAQEQESVLDMVLNYQISTNWSGRFSVRSGFLRGVEHVGHWTRFGSFHTIAWIFVNS